MEVKNYPRTAKTLRYCRHEATPAEIAFERHILGEESLHIFCNSTHPHADQALARLQDQYPQTSLQTFENNEFTSPQ
jgi:hypothetical protein